MKKRWDEPSAADLLLCHNFSCLLRTLLKHKSGNFAAALDVQAGTVWMCKLPPQAPESPGDMPRPKNILI